MSTVIQCVRIFQIGEKIEDNDYFGYVQLIRLWIYKTIFVWLDDTSTQLTQSLSAHLCLTSHTRCSHGFRKFLKREIMERFRASLHSSKRVAWMSDGGTLIHLNFSSDMIFSNILYDQLRLGMHAMIWLEEPRTNSNSSGVSQIFVRKLSWHKCFLRITIFYLNAVGKKCYFWDKQQIEMSGGCSKKCRALGILYPSKCRASLRKKCTKSHSETWWCWLCIYDVSLLRNVPISLTRRSSENPPFRADQKKFFLA